MRSVWTAGKHPIDARRKRPEAGNHPTSFERHHRPRCRCAERGIGGFRWQGICLPSATGPSVDARSTQCVAPACDRARGTTQRAASFSRLPSDSRAELCDEAGRFRADSSRGTRKRDPSYVGNQMLATFFGMSPAPDVVHSRRGMCWPHPEVRRQPDRVNRRRRHGGNPMEGCPESASAPPDLRPYA
jgi:hypothetical protein